MRSSLAVFRLIVCGLACRSVSTLNNATDARCANMTVLEHQAVNDKLRTDLLNGYSSGMRPVGIDGGPVIVSVDLGIISISELDVLQSYFELTSWYRLRWMDPRLTWDPDDYCGIDHLQLDPDSGVWSPDVSM